MLDSPGKPAELPRLLEALGAILVLHLELTAAGPISGR
jgi:hypothetical protein